MKLTDEQIKLLEEHNIELILREMKVRDFSYQNWDTRFIFYKTSEGYSVDLSGAPWNYAQEIPKFELTREKVLEWANHKDQQDTFVSVLSLDWQIANYWNYDDKLDRYIVRKNGESRPLSEVVEEWYKGREGAKGEKNENHTRWFY